jgi:hypothetical protein
MKSLFILAILVCSTFALNGCIPLIVGGYIGYQIAETHAHDEWCAQHVGDVACHP